MDSQPDLFLIAGARPNFMKIAPIWHAIETRGRISQLLVHTGQHHDYEMSRSFLDVLELPEPDLYLGPNEGSHADQTASIMRGFEKILSSVVPRLVVVVGDVNSTLACSLVAAKAGIPIAHVEAGLRSLDRSMPEEINRLVTDVLSDLHFTTCDDADENLRREGVMPEGILQVGNVMIDTLLRHEPQARSIEGVVPEGIASYALVTLHRPANVDSKKPLLEIVETLEDIAAELSVLFPVHPRTRQRLERFGFGDRLESAGVHLLEPQGYLRFLRLMLGATIVVTDSGGIQEETTVLGVPCLTMRPNTERPVTIEVGTNVLVNKDRSRIADLVRQASRGTWKEHSIPKGWDGRAAHRLEDELVRWLASRAKNHLAG